MNKSEDTATIQYKRLYWQCRRGLLELDLMLIPFLEKYKTLSPPDQKTFESLLSYTDTELQSWCLGVETAPNTELQGMIEQIRQHAKTRPSH